MRKLLLPLTLFITTITSAQTKNYIDLPYIEVNGSADTLVMPDEIFVKISLTEKDTRDKISLEDLERKMVEVLRGLDIDVQKNLVTNDLASNYKTYLLKSKDVIRSKQYTVKLGDAATVTKLMQQLETNGISNVSIERVSISTMDNVRLELRGKAIENAKARAATLTRPLKQGVGNAIHIADLENYMYSNLLSGQVAGVRIRGTASLNETGTREPALDFEKIRINANVQVKFILKN